MKFPYWVRHNDVDYAPGEDVPVEDKGGAKSPDTSTNGSERHTDVSIGQAENVTPTVSKSEYKKQLDKLNKTQLTEIVNANGVELPDTPENVTNRKIVEAILDKLYPNE
jgi:hypothetical protein